MTGSFRSVRFMLAALAPLTVLPACAMHDADDFRDGVPTREAAELKIPGAADGQTGALTVEGDIGTVHSALMGERAEYYTLTRVVTAVVNTGTVAVLGLVKTIVSFPPTSLKGDTAVWGPHAEPLSPNAWRLTVTRLDTDRFQYSLDGRPKKAPDSAFVTILSGTHTRAVNGAGLPVEGFGNGTFTLDWDTAQTLPEHDKNVGKATFTYARPSLGAGVTIDVDFKGVKDDTTGELHDATYKYSEKPGLGGDFQYMAVQDFEPKPGNTGTAKEKLTVHSRWNQDGAGRADVQTSGGDFGAVSPSVSECWNDDFASVFKTNNILVVPALAWGSETSCAFTPAAYSAL